MAYVSRAIAHDEKLIGVARLHWIYLVTGLGWLTGFFLIGLLLDNVLAGFFGAFIPELGFAFLNMSDSPMVLFCLCAGIFMFGVYLLAFMFTEVALTSKRIIHKTGMVFVKLEEVNLEEIKGEHINMGWFGRFLGYGTISLDARFVGDIRLPYISKPYRFVKAMNEAQSATDDDLANVIDDNIVRKANSKEKGRAQEALQEDAKEQLDAPSPKTEDKKPETQPQPVSEDSRKETSNQKQRAKPHRVSEGSYEEKGLKEDLIEDFEESEEEPDDVSEEDFRPSRQLK